MNPKHKKIIYAVIALLALFFLIDSSRRITSNDGPDFDRDFNGTKKNHVPDIAEPIDSVASHKSTCLASECLPGTKAVTYTSQQEPFYTCKSSELSDYANHVVGVMVMQGRLSEIAPRISAKTGEPEVDGKDKSLLDRYREKAGVSSFEEAMAKCYRGAGNLKVVVLYSPQDSNSAYVAAEDHQENKFWLPKARLIKNQE